MAAQFNHRAKHFRQKLPNLVNIKDNTNTLTRDKSKVYRFNCSDFIDKTSRSLEVLINKQIKRLDKSAIRHHLRFIQHNLAPTENSKLLVNLNKKETKTMVFTTLKSILTEMSYLPLQRQLI